jgi:hypothetical protein
MDEVATEKRPLTIVIADCARSVTLQETDAPPKREAR